MKWYKKLILLAKNFKKYQNRYNRSQPIKTILARMKKAKL